MAKKAVGFKELDAKLDRVIAAMATQQDIQRLEVRIDTLEHKFDKRFQQVIAGIDGLIKVFTDLQREYAAVKDQLDRHERWFKQIAEKTGLKLQD